MNTRDIANRLVALCRAGQYEEAQDELYGDDAVSIEMPGLPAGALGNVKGLAAIKEKSRKWGENISQMHSGTVSEPLVAGNFFTVVMGIDATYKDRGRMAMEEVCVYGVRDGKIRSEQFFYDV